MKSLADMPAEQLLSASQVAELLGVSRITLWRRRKSGVIGPPVRFGPDPQTGERDTRPVYWNVREVRKMLAEGRPGPGDW
jgi:predicted DNA-binding transcriptional regulator AlpA